MKQQEHSIKNINKQTISATNKAEMYDVIDQYIAEIYDQTETQTDDIVLIQHLIGKRKATILEPFCGHGRILIPLAEAGYEIVGLDLSERLLQSLDERLCHTHREIQERVSFRNVDVIADEWPTGFDIVVLGANCFYELATSDEQEHCIKAAAKALRGGGYLYLDNNHMEGPLDPAWCTTEIQEGAFPTGICRDGTRVHGTSQVVWYDATRRLVRFQRTVTIEPPDGNRRQRAWMQQKHPPSTKEMSAWLQKYGFMIEELWGDRNRSPYSNESGRAIFWARKQS